MHGEYGEKGVGERVSYYNSRKRPVASGEQAHARRSPCTQASTPHTTSITPGAAG
jgi:hypothetical protein